MLVLKTFEARPFLGIQVFRSAVFDRAVQAAACITRIYLRFTALVIFALIAFKLAVLSPPILIQFMSINPISLLVHQLVGIAFHTTL